jgi:hypothetical protein
MEPQALLSHVQEPATCPYPEPAQSSPWPIPLLEDTFLILTAHLRLGLPSGLLPLGLPTKIICETLLSPYVLHATPISFFSIWSPEYLVMSADH